MYVNNIIYTGLLRTIINVLEHTLKARIPIKYKHLSLVL